ncbi:phosphoenolpyruvate carboxykinase (ATP) [Ancylobacter rudongensis]|uniref:phosphoenolpyruvate carboxykinase (ATP) n=1 Tax=Ancylobacter rudongensis TaxID=177413 RepID=A0A1G4S0H3_9HYPH|nr:phosphoenolpyruvate carboxykinase (ATP) [Ancylobacter rudongensis]SCW62528.1 phosphoenolpyruvate carboxykinase (ATP) [Ancylobacter rudongensis]
MKQTGTQSDHSRLEGLDPAGTGRVFWNLGTAALCERAVARGEARLSDSGALVVTTAQSGHEIRLALVDDEPGESGETSAQTSPDAAAPNRAGALTRPHFEALKADLLAYVGRRTLFGQDLCVEAGAGRRLSLRILSDQAWHALFIRHLLRPCAVAEGGETAPRFTVLCAPGFRPTPETHGVAAEGTLALDLANGLALIAGTARTEAIRAALAQLLDGPLTDAGVLRLEGAAATAPTGNVVLFLGAAGAGKSALAAALAKGQTGDSAPSHLADGALGWGEDGLIALENAAYARPADLAQPEHAAPGFGAVLENIALDPASRTPDLAEAANTDVSRVILAQPSTKSAQEAIFAPPAHLFLLVQDASGTLPAIARLTPAQALGSCLAGMDTVPVLAERHAARLHHLLTQHAPQGWLVNTGWIGGAAGVGQRVALEASRRLVDAAQAGELASGVWRTDPHFGFDVPAALEGVDPRLLDPAKAWPNRVDHTVAARRLAGQFAGRLARIEAALSQEAQGAQTGMVLAAE